MNAVDAPQMDATKAIIFYLPDSYLPCRVEHCDDDPLFASAP